MPKETVLVADGDPRGLRMLSLALRRAGFVVETAADGGQAMAALREGRIQAVVCDAALPAPDGFEVCKAVRADEKPSGQPGDAHPVPLLLMGADSSAAAKARAIEAGADDYLVKPVLLKELVQRLQHVLDRRRLSDPGAPAPLTGSVSDLGLMDVFQSLEAWKKDAIVSCENGAQLARVWVREGEIVDAELGPVSGDAALWRLMTWEAGEFRVDPADVARRERRIQGGTQAALVEAMRRVDELARIAQELPMDSRLSVDVAQLEAKLQHLPDEVNAVLRHFDGARSLRAAIDLSPVDDLATLGVVRQLMGDGILRQGSRPASLQARPAASVPPAPAARPAAPRIVQFAPLRGTRRERLRREAEQARAKLAAGEPLRLHHVVELPAREGTQALGSLRRISPAVGRAAKTFSPDAPLARVLRLQEDEVAEPPIAPVATPTPPPQAASAPGFWVRGKWPWFVVSAIALALAWTLRPQPRTERRDSPWLQAKNVPPPNGTVSAGAAAVPPGYAEAVSRGNDLFRQGNYAAATGEYRKALALRPQAVTVLVSLGDAWLEADQPRSALEPLESAARLDPRSPRAQLLLGTTYHSLGRLGDAAKAYRRYLELEPAGDFAKDVKVILANLQPSR